VSDPTESAIAAAAGDMPTLRDSAIAKALAGETTFDEVARVSPRE
jgi:type II secretory ATPase GspE/PulE/Tfp pilus assembly ATPase PilB-like protein